MKSIFYEHQLLSWFEQKVLGRVSTREGKGYGGGESRMSSPMAL
jgi:hypothetical protein